jgi:hypothetical protein
MGRRAPIPAALKRGPFTTAAARQLGVSPSRLGRSDWRRLFHGVYVWHEVPVAPDLLIDAAELCLPPVAAFSGLTAAWLHGLDVTGVDPVEVTIPGKSAGWRRRGIRFRESLVTADDIVCVGGHRATSLPRTLQDLCASRQLVDAVVFVDMALHDGLVSHSALAEYVTS